MSSYEKCHKDGWEHKQKDQVYLGVQEGATFRLDTEGTWVEFQLQRQKGKNDQ